MPGVDSDVCKKAFTHDPQSYDFQAEHLPALYVFPAPGLRQNYEQQSEDWLVHDVSYRVFWLLPPTDQFKQAERSQALEVVGQVIATAIDQGRDASYVVEGDPDESAQYEGSVILRHAGLVSARVESTQITSVAIRIPGELKRGAFEADIYPGLDALIRAKKRIEQLPGVNTDHPEWGRFAGGAFTAPAALELSVNDGAAEAVLLPGYTMLYVQGGATAQTIGTTPEKLTCFAAAGQASGLLPDHAADEITVQAAGTYNVLATFDATGTTDRKVTVRLRRNGVAVDGVVGAGKLSNGAASFALSGQVGCADGDVLSLYVEADQAATSLTVVNATWSLTRI